MLPPRKAPPGPAGRASVVNPPNRFQRTRLEEDLEQLAPEELPGERRVVPTELLPDRTRSMISTNESPDIPYRWSINPYRGCEHGCAYCYARPGHELLGMSAGLDFETKILVKYDASNLLRDELCRPSWRGEVIAISGVTDCYQPAERKLGITRACLEVMLQARQPVRIATKNALVLRDLDILTPMAEMNLIQVGISITTLDAELARTMEPRTAPPSARLRAIGRLAAAGVPVIVLAAPVIPGLTDHELPEILKAAREAGAVSAGCQLLRLPFSVAPVFIAWLDANHPLARGRVESRIRQTRGGRLNDAEFGKRMTGKGPYAEGIHRTFSVFATKHGLDRPPPPLDSSQFRPPQPTNRQKWLF